MSEISGQINDVQTLFSSILYNKYYFSSGAGYERFVVLFLQARSQMKEVLVQGSERAN